MHVVAGQAGQAGQASRSWLLAPLAASACECDTVIAAPERTLPVTRTE